MLDKAIEIIRETLRLGDGFDGHRGCAFGLVLYLLGQEGHMDKAGLHIGILGLGHVQRAIEDVVAQVCAGREGMLDGDAGFFNCRKHGAEGEGGEVSRRAVLEDGIAHQLDAGIVGNAGFTQVDAHALDAHGVGAAGLAAHENNSGPRFFNIAFEDLEGLEANNRQALLDDLGAGNGIGQLLDSHPGGVDGFAAERIKTGDQNFHM